MGGHLPRTSLFVSKGWENPPPGICGPGKEATLGTCMTWTLGLSHARGRRARCAVGNPELRDDIRFRRDQGKGRSLCEGVCL